MAAIMISVGGINCENLSCNKRGVHIWAHTFRAHAQQCGNAKWCLWWNNSVMLNGGHGRIVENSVMQTVGKTACTLHPRLLL
jgi:hypothetical protein